jgi:Xaa-Pro aminopeptidase
MNELGIAAYIIPSSDPHLSEYLPSRWQGREHFSGFTGSVGTLIVTAHFAGLWVDTRYWAQAENELAPTGIQMMKINSAAATLYINWLADNLPADTVVGIDAAVLSLATARALQAALDAKKIKLDTTHDLLEKVWLARPTLPQDAVFEHLAPYAVLSRKDKLATVRDRMHKNGAQWHFISTVDDIAWLFNLRGADVSYNPVFVAHALIGPDGVNLYVSPDKVPDDVITSLAQDDITVLEYGNAVTGLAEIPAGDSLLIDPSRITLGFKLAIAPDTKIVEAINPCVLLKSRKNAQEAQFVRDTMEQDGAALCEFFSWLENALRKQDISTLTELTIDQEICVARARQPNFVSASFGTIAGFNQNGAMPHYRATEESHAVIEGDGLLLIDSGGQYLGGTTDITRVAPVGTVSPEQKRDFTLVLKGMIALSRMQFPRGTYSTVLDTAARAPIWAEGVNYGHGTGHGVGYFLNVHEGPQSISYLAIPNANMVMEEGMITSNEPGIYRPGKWGVRIENLMLCVPGDVTEFGEFLKFETLTLCPIDTRCIDVSLMRDDELVWLNDYHATVLSRLAPRVNGDAKMWLEQRTEALLK